MVNPLFEKLQFGDLIAVSGPYGCFPAVFVNRDSTRIARFFTFGPVYDRSRRPTKEIEVRERYKHNIHGDYTDQRIWKITEDNLTPEQKQAYADFRARHGLHAKTNGRAVLPVAQNI